MLVYTAYAHIRELFLSDPFSRWHIRVNKKFQKAAIKVFIFIRLKQYILFAKFLLVRAYLLLKCFSTQFILELLTYRLIWEVQRLFLSVCQKKEHSRSWAKGLFCINIKNHKKLLINQMSDIALLGNTSISNGIFCNFCGIYGLPV